MVAGGFLHAVHIRCRERGVKFLVCQISAAEEFPAIGRGGDFELMGLGKIRTGCAIGVDDAFG